MTIYTYLLNKKESGELSILLQVGMPTQLLMYMDIYAYHLQHPELSQFQVALHFKTCKAVIWKVYSLMNQAI